MAPHGGGPFTLAISPRLMSGIGMSIPHCNAINLNKQKDLSITNRRRNFE
jgi:hypothetical protein